MNPCEVSATWGRHIDILYAGEPGLYPEQRTHLRRWNGPFKWAYVQRGIVTQAGSSLEQYNALVLWMTLDPDAPPPDPDG